MRLMQHVFMWMPRHVLRTDLSSDLVRRLEFPHRSSMQGTDGTDRLTSTKYIIYGNGQIK